MIGPEDRFLDLVVEFRNALEHRLHLVRARDAAPGQHGQRAEAHRAAQQPAPVDVFDQRLVLLQRALVDAGFGPKNRGRGCPDHRPPPQAASWSTTGPPVIIAPIVFANSSARATGNQKNPRISVMPTKCTTREPWKL